MVSALSQAKPIPNAAGRGNDSKCFKFHAIMSRAPDSRWLAWLRALL